MSAHEAPSSISLSCASVSSFNRFFNFISTEADRYTLFGIVILFVEYVPTWRLGELCDDGK